MNKRAIVNVATGDFYCKMQDRLVESMLKSVDKVSVVNGLEYFNYLHEKSGIDLMLWRNVLPSGSRPHSESPYGFKVHAIKAAYEKGYTSVLWLDSPAYAVKEDISPIFEKIERLGYYAMSHIDPLENFVGDWALQFFEKKREQLKGLNLPSGSCYGFDLSNYKNDFFPGIGGRIFAQLSVCESMGLFGNESFHNGIHRHDEAILAMCLLRYEQNTFTFDPLFQSDSPECVIKSGGV